MSKESPNNPIASETTFVTKAESYFIENKKSLTIIGLVIVFLIGSFIIYKKFYKDPLEVEAQNLMWKAEYYFEVDSFNLAINGDSLGNVGFAHIVNEYSGTTAGNLASYYLGVCYLNTGEYQLAVEALEQVDLDDEIVSSLAIGACGDAYVELNQYEEALSKYEDAAENSDNQFTTPMYLKKAAMLYEIKGDFKTATDIYQRIYDDYEMSTEAIDIEKYLYRAKNSIAAN